jgi:gamma-glutamylcyclotransferase (GGCT)/AIG2-like uncharacterized protein YtfP
VRLFVYGTLVGRLSGVPAELRGWRLVALRGGRYPTLRRAFGGRVRGEVARANAATLRRLVAYEGPRYRLVRVAVATARGKTAAFAWISAERTLRSWP